MNWLRFFRRRRRDAELREEMSAHLANEIEDNIARGYSPEEARRAALRKFGNPQQVRERLWRESTISWLDSLWRNGKHSVRALRRSPGFAVVSIVVIALGIGVNAALFAVVRGVLLKPLPFADPQRLVRLYEDTFNHRFAYNSSAAGIFAEWEKQRHGFSGMAISRHSAYNLSGTGGQLPENLEASLFSASMLPVLGVEPALGRNFSSAEDSPSANGTVILSWNLWKRRFGGERSIVGQTILLDGRGYTVIGVMPSWFAYPSSTVQLWTAASHERTTKEMQALDNHNFQAVGRLKPGVSLTEAVNELSLITLRIHNAHADNPFISSEAHGRPLLESLVGNVRTPLLILLCATGCVLLIACLNIANLLVARSLGRRRELAIRTALGGSRAELLGHHLAESLLLSLAGGALGFFLAYEMVQWFVTLRHDVPRADAIHMDGVVLAFSAGLVLLTALSAGLVSAFSSRDDQVLSALQESSRSYSGGQARAKLRRVLLTVEVGLTVVLLIGAGLLLKSYARLRSSDLGCITRDVLTMQVSLPAARYDFPAAVHFYQELLTRVRNYPGVQAAGLVTTLPGDDYGGDSGFTIQGRPPLAEGNGQLALTRWVDPEYFAALGIPFQSGHAFDHDQFLVPGSEVIISAAFQRQYFPREDPVGKTILTMGERPYRIAGVVGDTLYSIGEQARPMMYFPIYTLNSKNPKDFVSGSALVVRSGQDVTRLALPVQKIFQSLDRDLAVSDILTMDQVIGAQTLDASFNATLLLIFALVSLVLAAVGLFGVVSYLAAQRTTEIGVRIALGAQRNQVLTLILRDGLRPALIGLVVGLIISAGVTRLISSMLYQTGPLDPEIFGVVALTLLAVAVAACVVPAWRAAQLNPVTALRTE
ncbi:ABC transporter permease [Occallatibacter savannae]|uniref:ABC transporter permease n=1 Tax=Occallatibacter savannae TaxID=1002691 RepID=UPI000D69F02F|nr:ABC transporter permease [Occallatibacter savannae]